LNVRRKILVIAVLASLLFPLFSSTVSANPIPVPTIIMPQEFINATIYEKDGGYIAEVHGEYPFRNVGYSEVSMKYPVPPDSESIQVLIDGKPVRWEWLDEYYETMLGSYRMITWTLRSPPEKFTVTVCYTHRLKEMTGKQAFLYALGTGRHLEYYAKRTVAYVNVSLLSPISKYEIYLGEELQEIGKGTGNHTSITFKVESEMFRPLTKDFLLLFTPKHKPIQARIYTDKKIYRTGEPVKIIFENIGEETIHLPNSAPWVILNSQMKPVFTPIALQVVTPVDPGDKLEWVWNQKDNRGLQVPPGRYMVALRVGACAFVASFEIRKAWEFPGRADITLRVYPEEAMLGLNATIKPEDGMEAPIKNLTVSAEVKPVGNITEVSLTVNAGFTPNSLERVPINETALTFNYQRPEGSGHLKAVFHPTSQLPLLNATSNFTVSVNEASTTLSCSSNFTVHFSKEYLSETLENQIEIAAALANTQAGFEMIKGRVAEATNGTVQLEALSLTFDRELGRLSGFITADFNLTSKPTLPPAFREALPSTDLAAADSVEFKAPKIRTADLTLTFSKNEGTFSLATEIVSEGCFTCQLNRFKDLIADKLASEAELPITAEVLHGLDEFTLGVKRRLKVDLTYPHGGNLQVTVTGLTLTYAEKPDETFSRIKNLLTRLKRLPRNMYLTVEAGSTQDLEVKLQAPSVVNATEKTVVVSGDLSALEDVTFEVVRNRWRVADYRLISKPVMVAGKTYDLGLATNSTVRSVVAPTENKIVVTVEGIDGTVGALNMSIPIEVLRGAPLENIEVYIDQVRVEDATVSKGEDAVYVYVAYMHSSHEVEVKWTVPTTIPLVKIIGVAAASVAVAAVAIIIWKKRASRTKPETS